jgi:hypothetical protein
MITFYLCRNDSDKTFKMDSIKEFRAYDFQGHIDSLNEFKKNIKSYVNEWNAMIDYLEEKAEFFNKVPYPISEHFYMGNVIH